LIFKFNMREKLLSFYKISDNLTCFPLVSLLRFSSTALV